MRVFDMNLKGKEFEYITKAIALGVGIGISLGALLNNVSLFFAIGGATGIFGAFIFIMYKRVKEYMVEHPKLLSK